MEKKTRKLSDKEQKRLAVFESTCERLLGQGYKMTNLTIDIVKANIIVMLLAIPVVVVGIPTQAGSMIFEK